MKICLITPLFEPWLIGGAERYVTILAKELSKNHKVVVITGIGTNPRKNEQLGENPKIIEIEPKNVASLYDMIKCYSLRVTIKKILWHLLDIWNISAYFTIKKNTAR